MLHGGSCAKQAPRVAALLQQLPPELPTRHAGRVESVILAKQSRPRG